MASQAKEQQENSRPKENGKCECGGVGLIKA